MSLNVWIAAKTLHCLEAGGHFWVYLNWALGLRSLGCKIVWLEVLNHHMPLEDLQKRVAILKDRLLEFGFSNCLSLCSGSGKPLPAAAHEGCVALAASSEADILLNMVYGVPSSVTRAFRRTVLIDIDPGLTQVWISAGQIKVAPHHVYFTIGETVGRSNSPIPDCGLKWHYTPPCVALDWWPPHPAPAAAPFTTISNWYMDEWVKDRNGWYINDKRSGFLPFLDLPGQTTQTLELALCMKTDEPDALMLAEHGWHVRNAWEAAATPRDYQRYIQQSRGEFSCVKPSCIRLQNAWVSDRTLCYLASGKPAVVQHTGPSRFLPDAEGLFRFRNMAEAKHCLNIMQSDYDHQCRMARRLAEELFDSRKVAENVLEKGLG
jgi:hypothetical protein